MLFFRRRHQELDDRVRRARRERELSEARLEDVREKVVRPIMEQGRRNQFAERIGRHIAEGYDR